MVDPCCDIDRPHPDGEPWKKACAVCAFRNNNPQKLSDEEFSQLYFEIDMGILEFYCIHREDDGHHRKCACFAAMDKMRVRYVDT